MQRWRSCWHKNDLVKAVACRARDSDELAGRMRDGSFWWGWLPAHLGVQPGALGVGAPVEAVCPLRQ